MEIYLWIVAATMIFGWLLPQQGKDRKYYIILMTILYTFVCAFRYNHLTGDLMKYHYEFNLMPEYGWFSKQVFHGGRNSLFYLLMKLTNHLTGADFQMLLIVIAVVTHVALAVVVYRYSPRPWVSYLVWSCLGFYIFGFNAIKQALAMGLLMLSLIGIFERRVKFFLAMVLLAGGIHAPALIFLPAYWLANQTVNFRILIAYALLGILMFFFRGQMVGFITQFYYEESEEFVNTGGIGNRMIMILLIALCGVVLRGFQDRNFQALFHFMCISVVLQLMASFDNIFTRLTDYYFQTSVLFIPMLFYSGKTVRRTRGLTAMFAFNRQSSRVMAAVVCVVLIWFYFKYNLGGGVVDTSYPNLLNFRFMWEVQ